MGYEISIIRKENPITLDEWKNCIETDDKMSFSIEGFAVYEPTNAVFVFSETYNMISVKNPDEATINKMIQIAQNLYAIVQGEEGELYNSFTNSEVFTDYEFVGIKKPKKWYEFWKSNTEKKIVFKKRKG